MKRDITRAIAEGEALVGRNERLGLDAVEMKQIKELCQTDNKTETMYDLIVSAYNAGLAIGYRNGRKRGES